MEIFQVDTYVFPFSNGNSFIQSAFQRENKASPVSLLCWTNVTFFETFRVDRHKL